jgi:Holliday junction resolvase RusA-like endonuclease
MRIILPLPPTDNNLRLPKVVKRRAQLCPTKDYLSWKKKALEEWNGYAASMKLPFYEPSFEQQLCFDYWLFKANNRTDSQNFEKALRDFLTGKLYTDDKHVVLRLKMPVRVDKIRPRVELSLAPKVYLHP